MADSPAMRLFVAVEIPPAIHAQVQAALTMLPATLDTVSLRWVRPAAWHLTLAFLGAVEERRVDDLTARLGRAAARSAPLTLRVVGAGRFRGNVLWAGLTGDIDRLGRLAASTGEAARRAGIEIDEKPYRAHLTLARNSGPGDLRDVIAALESLRTDAWTALELRLVRSRLGLGPGGTAKHEVVASWPLGRASTTAVSEPLDADAAP